MYKHVSSNILLTFILLGCAHDISESEPNYGEVEPTVMGITDGIPTLKFVVDENLDGYLKAVVRESLKDWADSTRCLRWFIEYQSGLDVKKLWKSTSELADHPNYTVYFIAGNKEDFPDKSKGWDWDGQGEAFWKKNSLSFHTGVAFINQYAIDEKTDRLVRHELGHAMGLEHDETEQSIMFGRVDTRKIKVVQVSDVWKFRDKWRCK